MKRVSKFLVVLVSLLMVLVAFVGCGKETPAEKQVRLAKQVYDSILESELEATESSSISLMSVVDNAEDLLDGYTLVELNGMSLAMLTYSMVSQPIYYIINQYGIDTLDYTYNVDIEYINDSTDTPIKPLYDSLNYRVSQITFSGVIEEDGYIKIYSDMRITTNSVDTLISSVVYYKSANDYGFEASSVAADPDTRSNPEIYAYYDKLSGNNIHTVTTTNIHNDGSEEHLIDVIYNGNSTGFQLSSEDQSTLRQYIKSSYDNIRASSVSVLSSNNSKKLTYQELVEVQFDLSDFVEIIAPSIYGG